MSEILPPLIYDGETLALARASTKRDGYLSKEDFILFSPEGAMPVNSFNTRTGEVVLLDDDVLAALGYQPINKSGDSMSGPLSLAADPTLAAHAASKNYVDHLIETSVAAGGAIGSYRVATGTLPVDPGNGKLAFNTTAQGDATELYISKKTDNNFDASNVWASVEAGRRLAVQKSSDATVVARFTITSVTDVMQFIRIAVVPLSSHGFPLTNNTPLAVAIAPITDEFLPISGGTLTGALTLAGDPLAALQAATRQYVDAHAGSSALPASCWSLSQFNASGSKLTFIGSISAGSLSTLTLTAASDFKVGQGILIGVSGSPSALVTTVSAIDATLKIITLATPAAAALTGANVQHDDTAACQAAIDYVFAQIGGTLECDPGFYRLNGPLNDIGSLLKLPLRDIRYEYTISMRIRGSMPLPSPGFFGGAAQYGTIFQTDVHNTSAAILRANNYVAGGPAGWEFINNIALFLENLTFRTYEDPQISGLDLGMLKDLFMNQVCVDAAVPYSTAAAPTATTTFGLRTPRDTASATGHILEVVWVQNYYTGIIFGEQMVCLKAFVMRCMIGLKFQFAFHPVVAHVVVCNCRTGLLFTERAVVSLNIDIQNTIADPVGMNLYRDFDDSLDVASGFVTYVAVLTESQTQGPAIRTGMTRCAIFDMGGTEPPQIPTTLAPLAAPRPLAPPFGRYKPAPFAPPFGRHNP